MADAHRREWASVLAATVRVTRDLDTAEEAVQGRGSFHHGQRYRPVERHHAALVEVETLEREGRLAGYQYLPSTKAELLHRLGRDAEAADAYQAALALTSNAAEEQFLIERVHATTPSRFNGSSGSEPPPSGVS